MVLIVQLLGDDLDPRTPCTSRKGDEISRGGLPQSSGKTTFPIRPKVHHLAPRRENLTPVDERLHQQLVLIVCLVQSTMSTT